MTNGFKRNVHINQEEMSLCHTWLAFDSVGKSAKWSHLKVMLQNETFWMILKTLWKDEWIVSSNRCCASIWKQTFVFKQGKNAVCKLWVEAEEVLLPFLIAEILVVAWKSHWRYRSHQYHDLHAWQRQGLRPLGGFGKRRMVLSRCLALFHQIGKHERSKLSPR